MKYGKCGSVGRTTPLKLTWDGGGAKKFAPDTSRGSTTSSFIITLFKKETGSSICKFVILSKNSILAAALIEQCSIALCSIAAAPADRAQLHCKTIQNYALQNHGNCISWWVMMRMIAMQRDDDEENPIHITFDLSSVDT